MSKKNVNTFPTTNLDENTMPHSSTFVLSSILLDKINSFCGYCYVNSIKSNLSSSIKLIYSDDFQSIYIESNYNIIYQIFNKKFPCKEIYIENYEFYLMKKNVIPAMLKSLEDGSFIKSLWTFNLNEFEKLSHKTLNEIDQYIENLLL
ncbi:MAG: hypothetical protein RSB67_00900 [Clostridia bacterium]